MNAEWFAGRLREVREQAGLTQLELAERAGLTKDAVARLERGARSPAWETVVALCQALKVMPNTFLHEPAERPTAGRGRPRKEMDSEAAPSEKQTRAPARKRKASR